MLYCHKNSYMFCGQSRLNENIIQIITKNATIYNKRVTKNKIKHKGENMKKVVIKKIQNIKKTQRYIKIQKHKNIQKLQKKKIYI